MSIDTGAPAPPLPALVDPKYTGQYVGCYRDGNVYWGGPQHDLPFKVADAPDMTVGMCLAACAKNSSFTHAAVQRATQCWCGTTYGQFGQADDTECAWPCGGDPQAMDDGNN